MIEIHVLPRDNTFGIILSESRENVRNKLGTPSTIQENTDYYQSHKPYLSVDYGANNNVEHISISNPNSDDVNVLFQNLDVFTIPASEMIAAIENHTGLKVDIDDTEIPYLYIFQDLDLSFWRSVLPENESDKEGKYFETVSIGVKGYYST